MEPKPDPAPGEAQEAVHALPPLFVGTLFASLLGGCVPGVFMTLVSEPGQQGSPVYGLLLPWSILPFLLATSSGWLARDLPEARAVRNAAIFTAAAGLVLYCYFLLFDARGLRNIRAFLYIPFGQWLVLSRPMMRAVLAWRRGQEAARKEPGAGT